MVLAAGFGRRLRPLTVQIAKPALPLMGRPLIDYILRRLARNGVREAVVNLHHRPETIEASLSGAPPELTIHRSMEPELLGTAGGLKKVECHFAGEDAFLLVNADTLVDFDLDALGRTHHDSGALATLLLRPKPPGSSYSSVSVAADGRIESIASDNGDWMFAGVWVLSPDVLGHLSGSPAGLEKELLPRLIRDGTAVGCAHDATWITVDTPRRYWGACLTMARERLFQEDWKVAAQAYDGPASVWAGARTRIAKGAGFHGEVVLGARCRVGTRAQIERVVCWDGVEVPAGAKLEDCVVTGDVRFPSAMDLSEKLVMRASTDRAGLRKREIRDELVIASLGGGRARGL